MAKKTKHLDPHKAYGATMGPLGFLMRDEAAKEADAILKRQPKEIRNLFKTKIGDNVIEGYCRRFVVPSAMEIKEPDQTDQGMSDVSMITTGSVDRDREVIIPEGGNFKNFLKAGGVVTFAHIYDALPVGRALWVNRVKHDDPKKDGWSAKTAYHTRPPDWTDGWFPSAVFHMIKEGGLKGKSIGFIPMDGRQPEEKDIRARPEFAGVHFLVTKWEALEYAVAPVQSNPDALATAVGKCVKSGIDVDRTILELAGLYLPEEHKSLAQLLAEEPGDDPEPTPPKKTLPAASGQSYDDLYRTALKRAESAMMDRVGEIVEDRIARLKGTY